MLIPALLSVHAALSLQAQADVAAGPVAVAPGVTVPAAEAAPTPLLSAGESVLFAGLSDTAVLSRAADAIGAIDTLRAGFTQISPAGNITEGTVFMDRPSRVLFDYAAPSAQKIVATGGLVYVHDEDLETTDSYPIGQTPLRFLLSDSLDTDGVVLTGVARMPGEVAIALQAADDEMSGEVALVFAGTEDALVLSRWAVVDPQGGVTEVSLSDVETGVDLSRRLFRIPQTERRFGRERR